MKLSASERESIWSYDESENEANVYTHNKALQKQLRQLAKDHPDECKLRKDYRDGSIEFDLPKTWLRIKPPRVLSEKQLAAARAALNKAKAAHEAPDAGQI